MTREDEIAAKAVRASTLKSIKVKKELRIRQIKQEAENKIREINIQYAEDPERLKAKYAAEDYAASEKAKKRASRRIEKERNYLAQMRKIRPFSLAEEIFSAIVQGIGACLFIAASVLLNVFALDKVPLNSKTAYTILYNFFAMAMILNYVMSTLYHALTPAGAKEVFKRLCRIFIFLIIYSTILTYAYTAYSGKIITQTYALVFFGILSVVCLTGILLYAIAGTRLEIVNVIFNAVMGWSGLFVCAKLFKVISTESYALLIASGLSYMIGLIFCSIRKVKFMHAIGNIIVLAASASLFFSFFFMY